MDNTREQRLRKTPYDVHMAGQSQKTVDQYSQESCHEHSQSGKGLIASLKEKVVGWVKDQLLSSQMSLVEQADQPRLNCKQSQSQMAIDQQNHGNKFKFT